MGLAISFCDLIIATSSIHQVYINSAISDMGLGMNIISSRYPARSSTVVSSRQLIWGTAPASSRQLLRMGVCSPAKPAGPLETFKVLKDSVMEVLSMFFDKFLPVACDGVGLAGGLTSRGDRLTEQGQVRWAKGGLDCGQGCIWGNCEWQGHTHEESDSLLAAGRLSCDLFVLDRCDVLTLEDGGKWLGRSSFS